MNRHFCALGQNCRPRACLKSFGGEQRSQGQSILNDRRFYNNVTEILFDTDISVEDTFHQLLIMRDIPCDKAQEVIISATHQVAFEDLIDISDAGLELNEILTPMVRESNLRKNRDGIRKPCQIDVGTVARNIAAGLQSLDPLQARARRQANGICEAHICHTPVLLQLNQYVYIDPIQLQRASHNGPQRFLPFTTRLGLEP